MVQTELPLKAVFWDMDGTLIDSEPLWHEGELKIAREHGGDWSEELAWQGSGTPVPEVAAKMRQRGCKLSVEEIGEQMIQYVAEQEMLKLPWTPGVIDVLISLREAGVPSVLVTSSPRELAENLIMKAPAGTFETYVCGDDDVRKKPDPEPYIEAAQRLGLTAEDMADTVAIEDSISGVRSAVAAGTTTVRQVGFMPGDGNDGPQFATIDGYDGITAETLAALVTKRREAEN